MAQNAKYGPQNGSKNRKKWRTRLTCPMNFAIKKIPFRCFSNKFLAEIDFFLDFLATATVFWLKIWVSSNDILANKVARLLERVAGMFIYVSVSFGSV